MTLDTIAMAITNILSSLLIGLMSPYPIVVIVIIAQYRDITYLYYNSLCISSPIQISFVLTPLLYSVNAILCQAQAIK